MALEDFRRLDPKIEEQTRIALELVGRTQSLLAEIARRLEGIVGEEGEVGGGD